MSIFERIRAQWQHAFAIASPGAAWDEADRELVDKLASFIVRRGLSVPALMVLESSRPINFLGSQLLAFLEPFATLVFSRVEYARFVRLLEQRDSVDLIMDAIAKSESETNAHG